MTQPLVCPHHPMQPVVAACARCGDFGCLLCLPAGNRICARCAPGMAPGVPVKPDPGKAIAWVFQDPRWLGKVLTGTACFLFASFIVPMMLFLGYSLRIARREREAPQPTLPEWDDLGGLLSDGFKFWIASMLPGFLIAFVFIALGALGFGAVALTAGQKQMQQTLAAVLGLGIVGFFVLMIPLAFLFAYAQPAMRIHYLRTGRLTSMLEFGAIYRIVTYKPGDYFMLAISCFVTQMLANMVGQLLCLVGILVTVPWALYTDAWLVGRYWAWLDADEQLARGA